MAVLKSIVTPVFLALVRIHFSVLFLKPPGCSLLKYESSDLRGAGKHIVHIAMRFSMVFQTFQVPC